MKLKVLLLSFLATTIVFVHGQYKIQGYILDKQTSEALPFAIISDLEQKFGCYTDTLGFFILNYLSENDSIKVSSLGYKSVYTNIQNLKSDAKIFLETDPIQLEQIVVTPKKIKTKVMEVGFSPKKSNLFVVASYSANINTTFIPFPKKASKVLIKSVKFTYQMAPKNYPLRIRILTKKTDGSPGDDIVTDNIVFNNYNKGRIQDADIDISKYNISMPQEGVFIALEWIMDKSPITTQQALQNGPYLGAIKTVNANNLEWTNNYNRKYWIEIQRGYIHAISLLIISECTSELRTKNR